VVTTADPKAGPPFGGPVSTRNAPGRAYPNPEAPLSPVAVDRKVGELAETEDEDEAARKLLDLPDAQLGQVFRRLVEGGAAEPVIDADEAEAVAEEGGQDLEPLTEGQRDLLERMRAEELSAAEVKAFAEDLGVEAKNKGERIAAIEEYAAAREQTPSDVAHDPKEPEN
jgi:hypothetical protein